MVSYPFFGLEWHPILNAKPIPPGRPVRSHAETNTFQAQNRGVVVTESGSYLRIIDACITQLKAHGPSRICNESAEQEEKKHFNACQENLSEWPPAGAAFGPNIVWLEPDPGVLRHQIFIAEGP